MPPGTWRKQLPPRTGGPPLPDGPSRELDLKGGNHVQATVLPEEGVPLPGIADNLALTRAALAGIRLKGALTP